MNLRHRGQEPGAVFAVRFFFTLFSEQFDETNIKSILEAVVALLEIDVPESKAKVLMLIAEIAKSGKDRTLDSLSCSLSW